MFDQCWEERYGGLAPRESNGKDNPFVDEITRELSSWRERGVTPEMLLSLCKRLNVALRLTDL